MVPKSVATRLIVENLFIQLTTDKKLHITGPLWGEYISDQWIPLTMDL